MNIYYFTFNRFPSEKAHALYVANVCLVFAENLKNNVIVVVPKRKNKIKSDYSDYYGIPDTFSVVRLACLDLFPYKLFQGTAIYVGLISFAISSFFYAVFKIRKDAVLFSNDAVVALVLSFSRKKVIYELHDFPYKSKRLYKLVFRRVYRIQTNNNQKITLLNKEFDIPLEKLYCAHNGVSSKDLSKVIKKQEARSKLGLPEDWKIILYTGHLFDWKGAETLAESASFMPDLFILFVGGTDTDVQNMKRKYGGKKNISFYGHREHKEIPFFLNAADVLVLPNSGKSLVSRFHTSPMKLFEYMTAQSPIVASDLPSIREVVSEDEVYFFEPDNPESLANVIKLAIDCKLESNTKVQNMRQKIKDFTWESRAKYIMKNVE